MPGAEVAHSPPGPLPRGAWPPPIYSQSLAHQAPQVRDQGGKRPAGRKPGLSHGGSPRARSSLKLGGARPAVPALPPGAPGRPGHGLPGHLRQLQVQQGRLTHDACSREGVSHPFLAQQLSRELAGKRRASAACSHRRCLGPWTAREATASCPSGTVVTEAQPCSAMAIFFLCFPVSPSALSTGRQVCRPWGIWALHGVVGCPSCDCGRQAPRLPSSTDP